MVELLFTDTQEAHHDEQDHSEEESTEANDLRTEDVSTLPLLVGICHADLQVNLEQSEPDQYHPDVGHILERKADPCIEDTQPPVVLLLRPLEFHHLHHYFARS